METEDKLASVNPICPKFEFRISIEDVRAKYNSLEDAFEDGAYMLCAEFATQNGELEGCSLVLSGSLYRGMETLRSLSSLTSRGLFCMALGEWFLGNDTLALETLTRVADNTPYYLKARRLSAVIHKEKITVFVTAAFLPVPTIRPSDNTAKTPLQKHGKFVTKNIGTQLSESCYGYNIHEPFDELIDNLTPEDRPDFIYALTPMWPPPKNLEKVKIPKVMWCHDTDVLLYRCLDNLNLYDVRIVNTSQEHYELGSNPNGLCVSNILSDPLSSREYLCKQNKNKDFDLLFSGSSYDSFHSEKSRLLYQLSDLSDDYIIRVIDGHVTEEKYHELLSRTKFLPIINRYAGCPSPRWSDALANSAYVLYPTGTTFGKAFPGCFPVSTSHLIKDIEEHLKRSKSSDPAYNLQKNTEAVAKEFSLLFQGKEVTTERQLKFAAFAALVLTPENTVSQAKRRNVWPTPSIDHVIYGRHNIREKISLLADSVGPDDLLDDLDTNNLAHLYSQLSMTFWESSRQRNWAKRADELFSEGCKRYPLSLVLHFNRAHWTFLKLNGDRKYAVRLFRELLDRWDSLSFDPINQDVGIAYTLGEQDPIFPYYTYGQLVTSEIAKRKGLRLNPEGILKIRNVLRAAVLGYIGWDAMSAERFEEGMLLLEDALRYDTDNLPLHLTALQWFLQRCESSEKLSQSLASTTCKLFLATVNLYPAILLSHMHRMCPVFISANHVIDLRHSLSAWYRIGNITYYPEPKKGSFFNADDFSVLSQFSEYFPESLKEKLRTSTISDNLTQFEKTTLAACTPSLRYCEGEQKYLVKPHRLSLISRILKSPINTWITQRANRVKRASVFFLLYKLPFLDGIMEAYARAKFGDPLHAMKNASLLQISIFRLTRSLKSFRGTK